ncbi:MAG: DNA-3-methyladenine glycosylase [Ardenticatenaceae bacterium]|nr:DNA-3-methyladenine glycosylase [Ardenticatenaceae bacterium]
MASHNFSRKRLDKNFYKADSLTVAQQLIGKRLVRVHEGVRLSGRIVETEAYCPDGPADLACHGSKNKGRPTKRTAVMFGPAGVAYVYFNYGIHWLFNVVTGHPSQPGAVLIRAIAPLEGIEQMRRLRHPRPDRELTNGPAKLTQAMEITGQHNGEHLCRPDSVIWIEDGSLLPEDKICCGPRIGLGQTPEPWFSMPWRFWLKGDPFVSK